MDTIKAKLAFLAEKKWHKRVVAAACALLLILLVGLCISSHMRANIQRKYSSAAGHIEAQLYEHLCALTQTFEYAGNPNVDTRYALVPALKESYAAADALNDALRNGFGTRYAVLSDELVAAFDTAFAEYDSAFANGTATGLAEADMRACMDQIQVLINKYYHIGEKEEVATLSIAR